MVKPMACLMMANDLNYDNSSGKFDEPALAWRAPALGLEDRIRGLCAKVVEGGDDDLEPAISQLKGALHEHNDRLRQLATAKLMR